MDTKRLEQIRKIGFSSIPIICGPTASGKSSFAISLASATQGAICACDSMQIYRNLSVGTAKPTEEEQKKIPHYLIDIKEVTDSFSVAEYIEYAYPVIDSLLDEGILPIFCGGTGQYVSSLLHGITYSHFTLDPMIEKEIQKQYEQSGIMSIYDELKALDEKAAEKIHPNNVKRVLHAVSLIKSTGKTMAEIKQKSRTDGPRYPFTCFCLDWPRDVLYTRINQRVDEMMKEGILEEAKWLYSMNLPSDNTAMQAIGYKELFPCLNGLSTEEECVDLLKQHTRNYAKRQLTWFRGMEEVHWLDAKEENQQKVLDFIMKKNI